jgi:MFS superfamily sulfate permease-like transporter
MEAINVLDMAGLDAIEEIRSDLAARGIAFAVARAKNEIRDKLIRSGLWERIGATNFYPSVRSAVQSGLNPAAGSSEGRQPRADFI